MQRIFSLAYGIVNYAIFFAVFLYLFGFAGDVLVPKSVSLGRSPLSGFPSILVNLALIALFGIQHSIMARPNFKHFWTQIIPQHLERSTFVLATNAVFILMYWLWQPMPVEIWNLEGTIFAPVLWGVFLLGMVGVLLSSFMINHFDLFGLRQTFLYFQGKNYSALPFKVTGFYQWVRNPLMLGFLMSFWAAPVMTTGRLLFASGMTLYIFIGIYFEERNIAEHLGRPYAQYRSETSMILPLRRKKISNLP